MSLKGLFGLLLLVYLAAAPISVFGQEVARVAPVEAPAPTVDGPLLLKGDLAEGVAACAESAAAPMGFLGGGLGEDSASSTLQASLCMCERCVCAACDCSGGVYTVRCCAMALGDICVAVSTCGCLQC